MTGERDQTKALRAILKIRGVPYSKGYRLGDGHVVNEDNVTTYVDSLGLSVTAEEDEGSGWLVVDLSAEQLALTTVARQDDLATQTARCVMAMASCMAYLAVPTRKASRGRALVADALRKQADALGDAIPTDDEQDASTTTAPLATLRAVERKLDGLCTALGMSTPRAGKLPKDHALAVSEGALAALTYVRVLLGAYGDERQRVAGTLPSAEAAARIVAKAADSYLADAPILLDEV